MTASKRTRVVVCVGAAVLSLSGLVAWAQIGASGTVLGCVGNSGIIRGVDETTGNCRSGDSALTWYTKAGADAAFATVGHTHDIPRADPPCFDNLNRYVDCGNGTVTDTVTGLIWLRDWNCLGFKDWAAANQAAAGLKNGDCALTDKSSPGDWRLPTKDEWSTTIAFAVTLGCVPSLTNDAGTCYGTGVRSSFAGVTGASWSSTAAENNPEAAWFCSFPLGSILRVLKGGITLNAWPVRGGSR